MLKLRGIYRWCKSNLFPQPHPILQINKLWPRSLNFSEEATLLARVPDLEPRYGTRVLWKAWCFYSPFIPIHLDFIIISLYLFHSQLLATRDRNCPKSSGKDMGVSQIQGTVGTARHHGNWECRPESPPAPHRASGPSPLIPSKVSPYLLNLVIL